MSTPAANPTEAMMAIFGPAVEQAAREATQALLGTITQQQQALADTVRTVVPQAQEAAKQAAADATSAVGVVQADLTQLQADFAAHRQQIEARMADLADQAMVRFLNDPKTWYLVGGMLVFLLLLLAACGADWVLSGNSRALTALEAVFAFVVAHAGGSAYLMKKARA